MKASCLKLGSVALVGLLAPIWWTFAVTKATHAIYLVSGSPERPTKALLWSSVYLPSFALGVVAGVVITSLSSRKPLNGWLIFLGSLVAGVLAFGIYLGTPIEHVQSLYRSIGNVLFLAGTLFWPAVTYGRHSAV